MRNLSLAAVAVAVSIACSGDGPTGMQDSAACATPVGAIMVEETVTGTLSSTSCLLADSTHADVWTLVVPSLISLQIDLGSIAFDAVLFVRDTNGRLVVQDDDSGPDLDSRILHTFNAGTYRIYANSYDRGDVGAYTLSVVELLTP